MSEMSDQDNQDGESGDEWKMNEKVFQQKITNPKHFQDLETDIVSLNYSLTLNSKFKHLI